MESETHMGEALATVAALSLTLQLWIEHPL